MTIHIGVANFRGCERADIECAPLALLAGTNGAGKSSICQAVACALSGRPIPFDRLTKKDAGALVRLGTGGGAVEVSTEAGSAQIRWPSCDATSSGDPPRASAHAAGLLSILEYGAEERARVLGQLLHADPTKEELVGALGDVGPENSAAAVWGLIESHGWDGAHAERKEHGAQTKGRWREVTRANYGSKIAAAWTPGEIWSDELAAQTEDALKEAVVAARRRHHAAIGREAASGAQRAALETQAAGAPEREAALSVAAEKVTQITEELRSINEELSALPLPEAKPAPRLECPACHVSLVIRQRDLTQQVIELAPKPVEQPPEADLKQLRLKKAELDGKRSNTESRLREAKSAVTAARSDAEAAKKAARDLEQLQTDAPAGESAAEGETGLKLSEARLDAFQRKARADECQRQITSNEKLIEILAADGLRARKLVQVLDAFNSIRLAPLCQAAGWKPVTVEANMAVNYGSRPYMLLSASEQYRVRAVVQVAIAKLDGSSMVVIDAADILDGPTRSGIFSLVSDMPALIALTLTRREQLPDLAAAGAGYSYWIEKGIAEPLGAAQQVAA